MSAASKSAQSQDCLEELRLFISASTHASENHSLDFTRNALSLLNSMPAAHQAVLEYIRILFDEAVVSYLNQLDSPPHTSASTDGAALPAVTHQDNTTIEEIHNALCTFVKSNIEVWAPVISTWSLELLGELSSRYTSKRTSGLNESLQLWMSCKATRTLVDINTQCLSCLIHSNTEACIKALLDTSVLHSPYFDWVVAHVGSCFPQTVITRVLSCGLKDYCQNQSKMKVPKLNSVVGILGHLAGSHFADIRKALLQLFQWSFEAGDASEEKFVKQQKVATVPYLLQLTTLSSTLLKALTEDVLHSVKSEDLPEFCKLACDWCCLLGGRHKLQELAVHLALCSEDSGEYIFSLLLETANHSNEVVAENALELLELLLMEIDLSLRIRSSNIPLLNCIQRKLALVQPLLLSDQELTSSSAARLLALLGVQNSSVLAGCASYLLTRASNDRQLTSLVTLIADNQTPDTLIQALALSLRSSQHIDSGQKAQQLWSNVTKLLSWECIADNRIVGRPMLAGVWDQLSGVAECLAECHDPVLAHSIASVLGQLDMRTHPPPSIQLTIALTHAVVSYFYVCISQPGSECVQRLRGCKRAGQLLTKLCQLSPAARTCAIRSLLESALFQAPSVLFGAVPSGNPPITPPSVRLLNENQKQGRSMLVQRHSSVFHAGVIGCGLRCPSSAPRLPPTHVAANTRLLMGALTACCLGSDPPATSLDAVVAMALLLVELISPDVMYNGLPWPDEEFCKVTVERDLCIRRQLDCLPLVWRLLHFIGCHRPALCYCSVLLRAVAASLLGQWGAAGQQRQPAGHNAPLIVTTRALLDLLALGQLLPPPLTAITHVVQHLPPTQVVQVLRDCVWNYMRDHVPSPALFEQDENGVMWRDPSQAKPPKAYTETLRLVMQRNIDTLGPLYAQIFLDSHMEQD